MFVRQVKLLIYHTGCWVTETTEQVRGIRLTHASQLHIFNRKGTAYDADSLWKVVAPSKKLLDKYLRVLEANSHVVKTDVVERSGSRALVFVRYHIEYSQFDVAVREGALPADPVWAENGIEHHTFVAEDAHVIQKLLKEIKKDETVKIVSISTPKKRDDRFNLTEKQRDALKIALLYDYYSWPRKITLEELSKIAGVSRKVFQEHLRKAEAKVYPIAAREALGVVLKEP